jgi:hypothetical protein
MSNQGTGKIDYSFNIKKFNNYISTSSVSFYFYYFFLIIFSLFFINYIRLQRYKFGTEQTDKNLLNRFKSYTLQSPFDLINLNRKGSDYAKVNIGNDFNNYIGFSANSYILIVISYIFSLFIVLEGLMQNHLFSIFLSVIQANPKNNPYNNPNMVTKMEVNAIYDTAKNYSMIGSFYLIFLVPFAVPQIMKLFSIDNFDIKKNRWFGIFIFFLLFFPFFFTFIARPSISKLNIIKNLDGYIEQKDTPYIDKVSGLFSSNFYSLSLYLFIVFIFVYLHIIYREYSDNEYSMLKYGVIIFLLFILIPLLLIFFNLSILFKNFGSDDYTKDIESYIKNNGIQNVFSLLVKYNYPCFEK